MSVIGKIGSGIGTIAARGIGLGAVGMVAYDAYENWKRILFLSREKRTDL